MSQKHLFLLSIPGLRAQDISSMPKLAALFATGHRSALQHSFPAVTWPSQATLLTGRLPNEHGVVANGFYWRDENKVEMWTAGNEVIQAPQIWDDLKLRNPALKTAAWFPMLSKRCGADFVCMPAPVHNPDGSESLWCYTKPTEYYGTLLESLDHFPLQNFWGPMASIKSTAWILDSAAILVEQQQPNLFYLYLPHLDYAAQRDGPDSEAASRALGELDEVIGLFANRASDSLGASPDWMAVSEYTIGAVDHVTYPNRMLRERGLLKVVDHGGAEQLDFSDSLAWALVDHQFSHVFVRDPSDIPEVAALFEGANGISEVLAGDERSKYGMLHERSGEVVLISEPNSWQAYYWWLEDQHAPAYARTVDIHRKPGYDPVEMFWDREANGVPLDATLVKGSHGAPHDRNEAILLSTIDTGSEIVDTQIHDLVLRYFD